MLGLGQVAITININTLGTYAHQKTTENKYGHWVIWRIFQIEQVISPRFYYDRLNQKSRGLRSC